MATPKKKKLIVLGVIAAAFAGVYFVMNPNRKKWKMGTGQINTDRITWFPLVKTLGIAGHPDYKGVMTGNTITWTDTRNGNTSVWTAV